MDENPIPEQLLACFPSRLADELLSLPYSEIDEIRLRRFGACSVNCAGKNRGLASMLSGSEMDATVKKLCSGSLYAYADTIRQGFISFPGGIRVGVGGRAVTEGGRITGVYDVSSLCVRLPRPVRDVGGTVCRLLKNTRFKEGVLVYSLPGVGKTTLLRSVIAAISGGNDPKRVAVIDTRGELGCFLPPGLNADILSGYPKGDGIEIAVRTLNPELIVCDEIGSSDDETRSIRAAQNCGVPLLATAHSGSVGELLSRPPIKLLHDAGIFGHYVGITRGAGRDYVYTLTKAMTAGNTKCG